MPTSTGLMAPLGHLVKQTTGRSAVTASRDGSMQQSPPGVSEKGPTVLGPRLVRLFTSLAVAVVITAARSPREKTFCSWPWP